MSKAIPTDDRGLLLGDGLFETLLAEKGELVRLQAHLDRMAAGCATLGLPAPDRGEAEALMREAMRAAEGDRLAVRLTLTAGSGGRGLDRPAGPSPRLFATASASPAPAGPARLHLARTRRNEGSPASRLKTLSYLDNVLAREEARAAGADEAVMLNGRGEIACAGAANLFWLTGERLFTPALDCGVLAGIVRGVILARAAEIGLEIAVAHAGPEALERAEAVVLTNSLIGVRPVSAFGARRFEAGPLAGRLQSLL